MNKIAIYGGSFNPPTKGHMEIIQALLASEIITKIIITPCGQRNKPDFACNLDRLQLLKTAIQHSFPDQYEIIDTSLNLCQRVCLKKILIDKYELQHGAMVPTADLLRHYNNYYPQFELYFTMGTDLINTMPQWEDFDYLQTQNYIVFERPKYTYNKNLLPNMILITDFNGGKYSSTKLREKIKKFRILKDHRTLQDVFKFTNEKVFNEIMNLNLYHHQVI